MRRARRSWFAVGMVAFTTSVLSGNAVPEAAHPIHAVGALERVEGTSLVLKLKRPTADQTEVSVPTDDQTVFTVNGDPGTLVDLQPGMGISAREYPADNGSGDAKPVLRVTASSAGVSGTLVKIDGTTLTIAVYQGLADPKSVEVQTDAKTKVVLLTAEAFKGDGPPVTLADLKPGMHVRAVPDTGVAKKSWPCPRTGETIPTEANQTRRQITMRTQRATGLRSCELLRRVALTMLLLTTVASGPATEPATHPAGVGLMPHVQVDVPAREVRVDCLAVKASYPLEFLACRTNSNEYESVVRTDALPSQVHEGLLMIGLKAGQPIHFDPASKTWLAPTGDRVKIRFRYTLNGHRFDVPAYSWMRDINTHQAATAYSWCFAGSTLLPDGSYAADGAGPIVGVINNQLSVLDVPALQSRALDARQWERDPDAMPPTDTPVTMVLSPADVPTTAPVR